MAAALTLLRSFVTACTIARFNLRERWLETRRRPTLLESLNQQWARGK
jgi:hypothetical protein